MEPKRRYTIKFSSLSRNVARLGYPFGQVSTEIGDLIQNDSIYGAIDPTISNYGWSLNVKASKPLQQLCNW